LLLRVVREHVSYEDLSGITRASGPVSDVEEFGERDFSSLAICRARAALPAATALGPCDVVAAALFEEAEARALVASWHGVTFDTATKRGNAPRGIKTRQPIITYSSWPSE
jgi:hypothetical protein